MRANCCRLCQWWIRHFNARRVCLTYRDYRNSQIQCLEKRLQFWVMRGGRSCGEWMKKRRNSVPTLCCTLSVQVSRWVVHVYHFSSNNHYQVILIPLNCFARSSSLFPLSNSLPKVFVQFYLIGPFDFTQWLVFSFKNKITEFFILFSQPLTNFSL